MTQNKPQNKLYRVTHEGPNNVFTVETDSMDKAADAATIHFGRLYCEPSRKRACAYTMWDRCGNAYSRNGSILVEETPIASITGRHDDAV